MRRETQHVLLILLGGALLKIALNGDYLRYVKPSHQPWLIAGGAVTAVLGATALVRDLLAIRAAHENRADHADHHHPARAAWLLVVPVLAVFLIAPPSLGSDSVTRTSASGTGGPVPHSEAGPGFAPLPKGDEGGVVPMTVTDFVTRAGWDPERSLDGRAVSLSGFVVRSGGDEYVARLVISCCAADAYPVKIRLTGHEETLPDDTWVRVTGTLVPEPRDPHELNYTPALRVGQLTPIAAPKDPYEH